MRQIWIVFATIFVIVVTLQTGLTGQVVLVENFDDQDMSKWIVKSGTANITDERSYSGDFCLVMDGGEGPSDKYVQVEFDSLLTSEGGYTVRAFLGESPSRIVMGVIGDFSQEYFVEVQSNTNSVASIRLGIIAGGDTTILRERHYDLFVRKWFKLGLERSCSNLMIVKVDDEELIRHRNLLVSNTAKLTVSGSGGKVYVDDFFFDSEYGEVSFTELEAVLCENEEFFFNGKVLDRPGSYTDTLQAVNGCDSIISLELKEVPSILFEIDTILCEGGKFEGIPLARDTAIIESLVNSRGCVDSVRWNIEVLPSYTMHRSDTVCSGEAWEGKYIHSDTSWYRYMVSNNGCDSIELVELIVRDAPVPVIEGQAIVCEGETIQLHVKGFENVLWSEGTKGPQLEINKAGLYSVLIKDRYGCIGMDTHHVKFSRPFLQCNPLSYDCLSKAGGVRWSSPEGGIGPYTLFVNGIESDQTGEWRTTRDNAFDFELIDSAGCVWDTSVHVVIPEHPDVAFYKDTIVIEEDEAQIIIPQYKGDISTYHWEPAAYLSCQNCPNPWYEGTGGDLRLQVWDANGCTDSAFVFVYKKQKPAWFTPNAFTPNGDGLNDFFKPVFDTDRLELEAMHIFDRWGTLVFSTTSGSNGDIEGWDGSYAGRRAAEPGVFVFMIRFREKGGTGALLYDTGDVTLYR